MSDLIRIFTERGDLAHLALLLWASAASAALWFALRELAAASRRFDDFVRELSRFNRRAHQRARFMRPDAARWMRPDAQRWIRPDVARFLKPGADPTDVFPALDQKYSPNQPRIPAGRTGGGRWASGREEGVSGEGAGGVAAADGAEGVERGLDGDTVATAEPLAFQADDSSGSPNDWNDLLGQLAQGDNNGPRPIPNAESGDVEANQEEVGGAGRRGSSSGDAFPGASAQQQSRLDQAIARSENAQTQIQRYEPDWRPGEQSLTAPGSVEGAIGRAEARAAEAETRLDQLRFGVGGNFGPALEPSRPSLQQPRVFDGGAWIDAYRTVNNSPNLFGDPTWPEDKGTVAAARIDGQVYFGVNSTAPGYSDADWNRASMTRDYLISKYPDIMEASNIGWAPNDALFHAESTVLLRAASDNGGSLANRSIEIQVDRPVCDSCGKVLTKLGLELGDPHVTYVETTTGIRNEMWNGRWLSGRYR